MRERLEAARARGRVLRYVGALDAAPAARDGRPGRARSHASVRQHQPHRQHRPLRDRPLRPEPAGRAGPGRRPGGHGGGRLRRSAARVRLPRGAAVTCRPAIEDARMTATSRRVRAGERRQRGGRLRRPRPQRRGRRRSRARARRIAERAASAIARDHRRRARTCRSKPSATPPAWRWRRCVETLGLEFGFELTIEKGIPLGSGLGGSAASAVAAVVAANALLADAARQAARCSSSRCRANRSRAARLHVDNIAPSLYGGLVLYGRHRRSARQADSGAGRRALRARASAHRAARHARRARILSRTRRRCRTSSGSRPTSPDSSPAASRGDLHLIRVVARGRRHRAAAPGADSRVRGRQGGGAWRTARSAVRSPAPGRRCSPGWRRPAADGPRRDGGGVPRARPRERRWISPIDRAGARMVVETAMRFVSTRGGDAHAVR